MELENTINLMMSTNYKERFEAEVYQLEIRINKLKNMLKCWDRGDLDFNPICPRELYDEQLEGMMKYYSVLMNRADLEGVELSSDLTAVMD